MDSTDKLYASMVADFEAKTTLRGLDALSPINTDKHLETARRDENRRPLAADIDGPTVYEGAALKRLLAVRSEFQKRVTFKNAFPAVRRLMGRLAAIDERGEDTDADIWECELKAIPSLNSHSLGSLGQVTPGLEADDRRNN